MPWGYLGDQNDTLGLLDRCNRHRSFWTHPPFSFGAYTLEKETSSALKNLGLISTFAGPGRGGGACGQARRSTGRPGKAMALGYFARPKTGCGRRATGSVEGTDKKRVYSTFLGF